MSKTIAEKIKDKELLKRYYRLPVDLVHSLNVASAISRQDKEQFVIEAIQDKVTSVMAKERFKKL